MTTNATPTAGTTTSTPAADTEDRCHCGSESVKTSDHCTCCGCEQFETTCDHVCDGVGCSFDHDLCPSCVTDNKRRSGVPTTEREMAAWRMWGCTCSADAAREAAAWMDLVTR